MITYQLRCADGHEFEGWFASSSAFDEQSAGGLLSCPICGNIHVEKAMMAPAVAGTKKSVLLDAEAKTVRRFMSGVRKYVLEHGENVGSAFAEEARKIHYGEAKERQIYGETTVKEAVELAEEGIDVSPLPPDPDETSN